MGRFYARVVARDDFDVPTRIQIWERGRRSRRDQHIGGAYLTANEDGYVDEYEVYLRGSIAGTVEVGLHHSSHGGIWPAWDDEEDRQACQAVYDVV